MLAARALHRNQLVWLHPAAWQRVCARDWGPSAQPVVQHWQAAQLPLVVAAQRVPDQPDSLCLGLPAPSHWSRQKLSIQADAEAVARQADFPALATVAAWFAQHPAGAPLQALAARLACIAGPQLPVQVYGSFGWELLTGMAYVRPASDLDLRIGVDDHLRARAVALALDALQLPLRVDGELAFPDGRAVAWREYLQWMRGKAREVLVKSRAGVELADAQCLGTGSMTVCTEAPCLA